MIQMNHHEEIIKEAEEDNKESSNWYKGPIKIILGLFMLLLIIMMVVPFYGVKQNPEPNYVPTLEELNIPELEIPTINSDNINAFVQVTPEIKQLADKIVTLSCIKTHKICNAKSIFYFVQQNFNYLNDPLAFEYYKTPQESLKSKSGDCDDGSILLSSLLQSIGLRTRFVFVPGHVYVQVRIPEAISAYKEDNNWINLDSTCSNCEFGEIHYSYTNSEKRYLE
jgi:transglutaminase-like putative cysteine protease